MSLSHVSTARGYLKGMHTQLIITLTYRFGTKQIKNSQEHLVGQAGGICPLAA